MAALARVFTTTARMAVARQVAAPAARLYSTELSPADFDAKWINFFDNENIDAITVRRGLNDVFAHDLVPSSAIIESALRATRRTNDFPTSVRVFEGIKDKAQSDETYNNIVGQLRTVIDELGLSTPEDLAL